MDKFINGWTDEEHMGEQAGAWTRGLMDRKTWINVWVDGQIDRHMDDR